ncbi:MAG: alpha/beta fold hydrolase [Alphaproteobacteria bacterium]
MAHTNNQPTYLEDRFLQPEGWRWHSFERAGRKIRFGSVFPKDSIPDAVVICLQGVREFSEKYYETAQWCLDNNFAFWTMDWAGQGKSSRFLPNPQKRHSKGFDADIADLHYFIMEYIKHSSVHPDKGRIPMAMIAHSMGANIGLRYLQKHPEIIECAAFISPMIGIKAFKHVPQKLALFTAEFLKNFAGSFYIPGGRDWGKRADHARLTFDPVRSEVQTFWCEHDEALQCGDVTFGWVYEAQKSCIRLQSKSVHTEIVTPCLFGIPEHEDLVDNKMALKVFAGMHNAKVVDYPNAAHEILMETDEIRGDFLKHFYNLVKENIINRPETLKPF